MPLPMGTYFRMPAFHQLHSAVLFFVLVAVVWLAKPTVDEADEAVGGGAH